MTFKLNATERWASFHEEDRRFYVYRMLESRVTFGDPQERDAVKAALAVLRAAAKEKRR